MGKHKGFTLIEVMLFLAISAALFAGIAMSMQGTMATQQYNDTVQNFFEFMQSIYSQVSNPESPKKGNSKQAIYGKLLVFGQATDLDGTTTVANNGNAVFVYDVLGDVLTADDPITGSVGYLLNRVHAGVAITTVNSKGILKSISLASPQKYELRWEATVDNTEGKRFKGAFLVVKHPKSGVINTLFSENSNLLKINSRLATVIASTCIGTLSPTSSTCTVPKTAFYNTEEKYNDGSNSIWKTFEAKEQVVCINPNRSMRKQAIKIDKNARNASGIQMMDPEASGSGKCN